MQSIQGKNVLHSSVATLAVHLELMLEWNYTRS